MKDTHAITKCLCVCLESNNNRIQQAQPSVSVGCQIESGFEANGCGQ